MFFLIKKTCQISYSKKTLLIITMGGRKKLTGAILQTSELEILSDPKHPDHEEIKEWMGDDLILLKEMQLG